MDCCKTKHNDDELKSKEMKGGQRKMNLRNTLWVVIIVLFVIALFLIFNKGAGSVETVQTAGSAVKSAASGGMVGGC